MKAFAELYNALDESTRTTVKVAALAEYFRTAPPADAGWAISFLIGRKPRQVVGTRNLREWAAEEAAVPLWLFEESYHAVGDLAETIALLLPVPKPEQLQERSLCEWVENHLLPMSAMDETDRKNHLLDCWRAMTAPERFIWNKLITGAFRVGVSQNLVTRALAEVSGLDAAILAHRLMGDWKPSAAFYLSLIHPESRNSDPSRLYPFYLAHPLEEDPHALGIPEEWSAEWKWDGIRAQLIRRNGELHLWSRGEELVTERYPELHAAAMEIEDGTVLDGELLPWNYETDEPMPFAQLQKRIGRKTLTKKILGEIPVALVAYDILEHQGSDIREESLRSRRRRLELIVGSLKVDRHIRLSPLVDFRDWSELAAIRSGSRQRKVEGLMLKRLESPYRVGRKRGDWWKWKIEPLTMDCVLTMAQRGSGRRASLFTDYTFAVWDKPGGSLVTVAKAYSGLTDAEITTVDSFVKKNTTDKFGPVRAVRPEIVMELAFEGIQESSRHKSGIAVRFPRIVRIRHDKKAVDADTLEHLRSLLVIYENNNQTDNEAED